MEYFILTLVCAAFGITAVTVFKDVQETATKYSINIGACELIDCEVCAQGAFLKSFKR